MGGGRRSVEEERTSLVPTFRHEPGCLLAAEVREEAPALMDLHAVAPEVVHVGADPVKEVRPVVDAAAHEAQRGVLMRLMPDILPSRGARKDAKERDGGPPSTSRPVRDVLHPEDGAVIHIGQQLRPVRGHRRPVEGGRRGGGAHAPGLRQVPEAHGRADARGGLRHPGHAQGAFYIFADASRWTDDSYQFFEPLEKAGVGVAPGVDFGQAGKRAVRFSYASS